MCVCERERERERERDRQTERGLFCARGCPVYFGHEDDTDKRGGGRQAADPRAFASLFHRTHLLPSQVLSFASLAGLLCRMGRSLTSVASAQEHVGQKVSFASVRFLLPPSQVSFASVTGLLCVSGWTLLTLWQVSLTCIAGNEGSLPHLRTSPALEEAVEADTTPGS